MTYIGTIRQGLILLYIVIEGVNPPNHKNKIGPESWPRRWRAEQINREVTGKGRDAVGVADVALKVDGGTESSSTMMVAVAEETDQPSEEQRHKAEDATSTVVVDPEHAADDADDEQVAIELTSTSQEMKLPAPPSECRPNADPHLIRVSASSGQEAGNTGRRRVLHHPILSPLTKLPWGRLAGSCDLLFNCKYTMRQVQDEIKHERIENGNEGAYAAYENQSSDRKDGYVSVNLGLVEQEETEGSLPFFGLQEHEAADVEESDAPATDAQAPETEEVHNPVADALNMMVYNGLIGE